MSDAIASETRERAARTGGASANAIYRMIERALAARDISGNTCIDLGCGYGALQPILRSRFKNYIGVDAVGYSAFPSEGKFVEADLNAPEFPLSSQSADAVLAVETIEHLENPRAFMREMKRVVRPGGWILVTTPNQQSFLSLATLIFKKRFSAFQDVHYPAHITALLECDLLRIAAELALRDVDIEYSHEGRIILTPLKYPGFISGAFPRLCSDNLLLVGRVS